MKFIGVITVDKVTVEFEREFFFRALKGVLLGAKEKGFRILVEFINEVYSEKLDLPEIIKDKAVSGLIILGGFSERFVKSMIEKKIPVVLIESYIFENKVPAVLIDNRKGAYLAVKYLIDMGHKKIGMIGGEDLYDPTTRERYYGYKDALKEKGITPDKNYEIKGNFEYDIAYESVEKLIKTGNLPTAMFVMNDRTAIAAMNAFRANKIRVPEDVSIVGFDDISMSSRKKISLTTVHVPYEDMGKIAVKKMEEILEGKTPEPIRELVSVNLIARNSVRKV